MPDVIDATGLTVETAAEITAFLDTNLQTIYGPDINTDQNSPDGQCVGILTQLGVDLRELIMETNDSFDPDQAGGVLLDQRCAINNIERIGGTYTDQPITLVVSSTVVLQGLDANFSNPNGTGFTVQDGSGNQFILTDTTTFTAGTYTNVSFRARQIGAVKVPINTITNLVTIIPGVVSVNNPSAAITVGQNQETDAQLRIRRQQSVSLAAGAYTDGLRGVLLALAGVTEAVVYENNSGITDANGIPGHSIWAVVAGGANSGIAAAIYAKHNGGGMKGTVVVPVATSSGIPFDAAFDRPTAVNLFIRFNLKQTVAGFIFDQASIKASMVAQLVYEIGQFAETSVVTDAAQAGIAGQGGGGVPLDVQISPDGSAWTDYLAAPTLDAEWTLDASRIAITVV